MLAARIAKVMASDHYGDEAERDVEGRADRAFLDLDLMLLAVQNAEVERQHHRHNAQERQPHLHGLPSQAATRWLSLRPSSGCRSG
jgi:hypothetical protein